MITGPFRLNIEICRPPFCPPSHLSVKHCHSFLFIFKKNLRFTTSTVNWDSVCSKINGREHAKSNTLVFNSFNSTLLRSSLCENQIWWRSCVRNLRLAVSTLSQVVEPHNKIHLIMNKRQIIIMKEIRPHH